MIAADQFLSPTNDTDCTNNSLTSLIYWPFIELAKSIFSLFLTCVACVCWLPSAHMLATICADVGDNPRVLSPANSFPR